MKTRTIVLVIGVLLLTILACNITGAVEEPTPYPTYTPAPTYTSYPEPEPLPTYTPYPEPEGPEISPYVIGLGPDTAYVLGEIGEVLVDLGWEILSESPDLLILQAEDSLILTIKYLYDDPVGRVIINAPFFGVGATNLNFAALQYFNELNTNHDITKVSVRDDGDVDLETTFPAVNELDIEALDVYMRVYSALLNDWIFDYMIDYLE
nr:YbjN domain-containing protein [Anaerolineae bacterium]